MLRAYPRLRLCVPHLGADEFSGYALLERYDTLWLDTTMSSADFFDIPYPMDAIEARAERAMNTDFPNIPYAWDREVLQLSRCKEETLAGILGENARAFFRLGSLRLERREVARLVGELRFQADELGRGPLVILLHGFPDHRGTWRHQLPALAAAGFTPWRPA